MTKASDSTFNIVKVVYEKGTDGQSAADTRPSVDDLRAEYAEVNQNFRTLADIRFKLLAFLPIGTVATILFGGDVNAELILPLAVFGLAITLALMVYNERNDQHYGELVSRAAEIERELALLGGQFNQRPASWLEFRLPFGRLLKINHPVAVGTIYQASLVAWLTGIVYTAINWGVHKFPITNSPLGPPDALAIAVVAGVSSFIIVRLFSRRFKDQRRRREELMRRAAFEAVKALCQVELPLIDPNEGKWLEAFRALAVVRGDYARDKEKNDYKVDNKKLSQLIERAKAFLSEDADESSHVFLSPPSAGAIEVAAAAQIAALLSGQSARWFLDTYSKRSGKKMADEQEMPKL